MLMQSAIQSPGFNAPLAATVAMPAPPANDVLGVMGSPVVFRRNADIYGEHEEADYLYKVVSGAVRAYRVLADGRRQIGAFYLAGDIFGLEGGERHTFSVEAVCETRVLMIRRSALVALAAHDADVAHQLWTVTSRELQRAQDHVLALIKTAEERVVGFLLEMAGRVSAGKQFALPNQVELPMCRQDIADYLGLTVETVCRTMTLLEHQAAIALPTARRVVLRNRTALSRLSG